MSNFNFRDKKDYIFIDGVPVRNCNFDKWVDPNRRKEKYGNPYNYDEFFIFGNRQIIELSDNAYYSDRLSQWNYEKNESCWNKHCKGSTVYQFPTVSQLSAYLSDYWDKPQKVIAAAEGCNPSTGYPYWIYWIKFVKEGE